MSENNSNSNGHSKGYANAKARRERFVAEYIISQNATKAAQKAGYSEHSAYSQGQRLLKNVEIREQIAKAHDDRLKRLQIDADYVLQGIQETVERCRQIEPVLDRKGQQVYVETPDGSEAPAFTFNALGALKGYELLGKHLKLFTERIEHIPEDITAKVESAIKMFIAETGGTREEAVRYLGEFLPEIRDLGKVG